VRVLCLSLCLAAVLAAPAHAIVGGQPATKPYPYAAQLYEKGDFICGGQLVRPNWVLTAAHCVENGNTGQETDPGDLEIRLGRTKLSDSGGEVHAIAAVVQHENYRGNGSDIALLKLARDATATPLRIVTAAERPVWAPGITATIVGWGATMFGGGASDELREAEVTITDDGSCETTGAQPTSYEETTMFCAGEPTGGRDSCQGDSGGPLLVPDASGAPVLAGVVSFGTGCAFPLLYGVYARVGDPTLRGWLDGKIGADPVAPGAPAPPGTTPPGTSSPPPGGSSAPVTRLRVASDLGTAKVASRRRRIRVRVSTNRAVNDVRIRILRGTKLIAKGRLATLDRRGVVTVRLAKQLKRGTYGITVEALDASGKTVRTSRTARLR